jgi:hypothetical protein
VDATLGAGAHPLNVSGEAYLAGPYKGAPLSIVAVVPAVAGPYDLGVVAVRAALYVDPATAQARAVSDPLPQVVDGIPLRLRSLLIDLDRQGFTLNPTNCEARSVVATVSGDEEGTAIAQKHFQVANCATLPYRPRLAVRLSGGLKRLGHPAIHGVLKSRPGEANSRSITVTLPRGELLDNKHVLGVCTKGEFAAKSCPVASRIGQAEVTTPILEAPLSGPVYLRSSSHGLPDLALDLQGQINVEAVGRVDDVHQRYRVSFPAIPDIPVSQISLSLAGGHKGLLQNGEPLCGTKKAATVRMTGQNGATSNASIRLQIPCGSHNRGRRHRFPRAVPVEGAAR